MTLPAVEESDERLASLLSAGPPQDARAFAVLYARHRDWALRVARRFAGSDDLAHDAVQEAFLYLVRKGGSNAFRLTARLTTFLYPVVKHGAQEARRKSSRALGVGGGGAEETPLSVVAAPQVQAGDPDGLRQVLARLPEEQREAILLRFVDGLSMAEIAAATQVPEGTVKTRLHHAVRKLREDPVCQKFFGQEAAS